MKCTATVAATAAELIPDFPATGACIGSGGDLGEAIREAAKRYASDHGTDPRIVKEIALPLGMKAKDVIGRRAPASLDWSDLLVAAYAEEAASEALAGPPERGLAEALEHLAVADEAVNALADHLLTNSQDEPILPLSPDLDMDAAVALLLSAAKIVALLHRAKLAEVADGQ